MQYLIEDERIHADDETGRTVAEIRFPRTGEGEYTITRTFVDDSLRGQGVAGKLTELAVAQIEGRGGRVRATCSYAAAWLQKHR